MSPFLQWNKTRNLNEIFSEMPIRFNNYYEPFLKSGEVFFNLFNYGRIFEKAYISSSDRDLINAYRGVRDEPERLQKMILRYCENNSKAFFENMKLAQATPSAYIYVNRAMSKDGKWRESQFIDRNKEISKDVEEIDRCSRYMNRWCGWIFNSDWESALTNANEGDVIWLEPPKIPYTQDARIDLFRGTFSEANHIYLNNYCKQLRSKGVKVFMIQDATPATTRIYGTNYKVLSNNELLYK
jgi:DNA adenine methylase